MPPSGSPALHSILSGVPPTQRTSAQRWALASHMRQRKELLKSQRKLRVVQDSLRQLAELASSAAIRNTMLVVRPCKNLLGVQVVAAVGAKIGKKICVAPQGWLSEGCKRLAP